ncbi:hypothetical protein BGZ74_005783 [Mortierella antarctica]|nr:hypothetical protein BGZ74_005783 [Mortierella antarctica]
MTIFGAHLEHVPEDSNDFDEYKQKMGRNLFKLFKIEYNETASRNLSGAEWSAVQFFHGTGHCDCVTRHAGPTLSDKIATATWCASDVCVVGGILRPGDLMNYSSSGGRFFSSSALTALSYAQRRHSMSLIHAVFICKACNISGRIQALYDIHPVYLAIVSA